MNQNKGVWAWVIGIIIVILIALGLWWISSDQSVNSNINMASSTAATTTPAATGPTMTDMHSDTVQAIVGSLSDASQFQSLLSSTGVGASLKAGTTYTIFVPTDGAFNDLAKGTLNSMTAAQLKRLVEYHIVSGRAVEVGTQTLGEIQALSGDPLNFSDTNNIPMVNSSIVVSEYQGSNGIVYVINDVLLPPQKATE